jgi:hypothetical protein|tara:strand:- start:13 stop:1221 length:1209 start_codon:yes stop_codon:yes gene_type:complete
MALITENNAQYYAGTQDFLVSNAAAGQAYTCTFDTDLVFGSHNPLETNYALNNFKLYTAAAGVATYTEYTAAYTVLNNVITITAGIPLNTSIVVQLKTKEGGQYGNRDAYGNVVEENWGSYAYIKLNDIIDNYMVGYVGDGKLVNKVKKSDVLFFAKRGLQEFSYDTLKSIKSQELTIPPNLSVPIPQDYVNYVNMSWIDQAGIKHIIYPTTLTSNPYKTPIQDGQGVPTQDNFDRNLQGTSITNQRWKDNNLKNLDRELDNSSFWANIYGGGFGNGFGTVGGQYGIQPEIAQINGWFTINERENKFSFSSDLSDKLIILSYISDGLAIDSDTRVPKMAEEAMYAYISHAIISTRSNQPEYVVNRLSREKAAKLRNAKIRLSNIKLEEFTQIMRGKSKWIKN